MSHYTSIEVEIKDTESFIEALLKCWSEARGMNLTRSDIEVHETPQKLFGYRGDMRETEANIIIRRNKVGSASNDIGYMIKDGKCTELISEFDRSSGYGLEWSKKVKQNYASKVVVKAAVKKGYKLEDIVEEKVDGKIRLTMRKKYEI